MTQAQDEAWLHRGWAWLERHQDAPPPPYAMMEERWFTFLRRYEEAYRLITMGHALPIPDDARSQAPLEMPPGTQ